MVSKTEETEHLLPISEKEQLHTEVYEVVPLEERQRCRRTKRPLWRRIVRWVLTVTLIWFLAATVVPMFIRPFFGCRMHHLRHHSFDSSYPIISPSSSKPKTHFTFNDTLDYFYIKQESQKHLPGPRTDVHGKVVLEAAKDANTKDTKVNFDIKVSDDRLWEYIKIQPQKKGVVFSADPWSLVNQHVSIVATVIVPQGAEWKGLYVGTRELNIRVKHALGKSLGKLGLESVSGDIDFDSNSSEMPLISFDDDINGNNDDSEKLSAGWMKLRSVSGHIKGSLAINKGLDLATASGNINIQLYTIRNGEDKIFINSKTVSGESDIHLVHPLQGRHLKSKMVSVSGNIKARYPEEWQGTMKMTTTSGLFDVKGKNVEFLEKKKTLKGLYWKFIKGDRNLGCGKMASVSGNINASVGDN